MNFGRTDVIDYLLQKDREAAVKMRSDARMQAALRGEMPQA